MIATHRRECVVETADGAQVRCHLRGAGRDVVAGDLVPWQAARAGSDEGVVQGHAPRRSLLFRQDATRTKAIAANIDQVLILLAAEPAPAERFLARALVACEAASVRPLIALNKADLRPAFDTAWALVQPYAALGYRVLAPLALAPESAEGAAGDTPAVDAAEDTDKANDADGVDSAEGAAALAELRGALDGAVTLAIGASGVGKSTLVNRVVPDAGARTGALSRALKTGTQTTTSTRWYWLDAAHDAALVDSPGFLEFGLHHIAPQDLARYLPDFRPHLGHCRFANCSHTHEPGCAVSAAVRDAAAPGAISAARYAFYCELLAELRQAAVR